MRTSLAVTPALATALTFILPATQVAAQDIQLPTRSPGQWEITIVPQTSGAPSAMTMQLCVDEDSDSEMMLAGIALTAEMCSTHKSERQDDAYVIEATCRIGQMKTISRIVVSGDFQSAYTVEITSQTIGAMEAMAGTNHIKQEARWIGAECAEGLAPGEMSMPGIVKMNASEMMKKIDEK